MGYSWNAKSTALGHKFWARCRAITGIVWANFRPLIGIAVRGWRRHQFRWRVRIEVAEATADKRCRAHLPHLQRCTKEFYYIRARIHLPHSFNAFGYRWCSGCASLRLCICTHQPVDDLCPLRWILGQEDTSSVVLFAQIKKNRARLESGGNPPETG